MKISLSYPKIPDGTNCPLKQCVAFEKVDGTNIHFTWKDGAFKFGTRRDEFPLNDDGIKEFSLAHVGLEEAPLIFLRAFTGILNKPTHEVTLFTEFLGKNSFAGAHQPNDKKKLILFDAMVNGKLLDTKQFLDSFSTYNPPLEFEDEFDIPKIVYSGKYTGQFVEDVRAGKYPVNEGVICKGVVKGQVYMTKIKTNAYMEKLKLSFNESWKNYWE